MEAVGAFRDLSLLITYVKTRNTESNELAQDALNMGKALMTLFDTTQHGTNDAGMMQTVDATMPLRSTKQLAIVSNCRKRQRPTGSTSKDIRLPPEISECPCCARANGKSTIIEIINSDGHSGISIFIGMGWIVENEPVVLRFPSGKQRWGKVSLNSITQEFQFYDTLRNNFYTNPGLWMSDVFAETSAAEAPPTVDQFQIMQTELKSRCYRFVHVPGLGCNLFQLALIYNHNLNNDTQAAAATVSATNETLHKKKKTKDDKTSTFSNSLPEHKISRAQVISLFNQMPAQYTADSTLSAPQVLNLYQFNQQYRNRIDELQTALALCLAGRIPAFTQEVFNLSNNNESMYFSPQGVVEIAVKHILLSSRNNNT